MLMKCQEKLKLHVFGLLANKVQVQIQKHACQKLQNVKAI